MLERALAHTRLLVVVAKKNRLGLFWDQAQCIFLHYFVLLQWYHYSSRVLFLLYCFGYPSPKRCLIFNQMITRTITYQQDLLEGSVFLERKLGVSVFYALFMWGDKTPDYLKLMICIPPFFLNVIQNSLPLVLIRFLLQALMMQKQLLNSRGLLRHLLSELLRIVRHYPLLLWLFRQLPFYSQVSFGRHCIVCQVLVFIHVHIYVI